MRDIKAQLPYQTRERILGLMQELGPNERLPGEAALATKLSVSRATVRDALTHLERDGLIIRRHGIGTFVAPQPAQLGTVLNEIRPIPEVISASGFTPKIGSLRVTQLVPPPEVRQELHLGDSAVVPAVDILFLASGEPAIYITYFLCPDFTSDSVSWHEFDGSMVDFVERTLKTRVHQTHARIAAVPATEDTAKKLSVKVGQALLRFTTVAFLMDGRPAYSSISYQDSDVLEVRVIRNRKVKSLSASAIGTSYQPKGNEDLPQ